MKGFIACCFVSVVIAAAGCDRSGAAGPVQPSKRTQSAAGPQDNPYAELAQRIGELSPGFAVGAPQDWSSFRDAGATIRDRDDAVAAVQRMAAAEFVSPADYSAAGSFVLPHVNDMAVAFRFSLALAVR